jgi:hypothetical protein
MRASVLYEQGKPLGVEDMELEPPGAAPASWPVA